MDDITSASFAKSDGAITWSPSAYFGWNKSQLVSRMHGDV